MKIYNFNQFDESLRLNEMAARKNADIEVVDKNDIKQGKVSITPDETYATLNGEIVKVNDYSSIEGEQADDNNSNGAFDIDAPAEGDDKYLNEIPKDQLSMNIKRLKSKFLGRKPFFVQGDAGWGKTTIIKRLAKKYGYTVITVYLDKALKEDLGGITVPAEVGVNKSTNRKEYAQQVLLPLWAQYMLDHSNEQFLLFFDEMNQADGGVTSALMPIVYENVICGRRFKNFFVAAAGNFYHENKDAIFEIGGPLLKRFGNIIIWDCDWDDAFKHLHEKYDKVWGKDFVDEFKRRALAFTDPRSIELHIFEYYDTMRKDPRFDAETDLDIDIIKEELIRISNTQDGYTKDKDRHLDTKLESTGRPISEEIDFLAELIYSTMTMTESEKENNEKDVWRDGDEDEGDSFDFNNDDLKRIQSFIVHGYVAANGKKSFPFTKENAKFILGKKWSAQIQKLMDNELSKKGMEWRYETNQDAIDDGWDEMYLENPDEPITFGSSRAK